MSRVSFEVQPEPKVELEKKAQSLGMSLAGYARKLVLDGSRRGGVQGQQADLLRAMRALAFCLGDAMGRIQKFPLDLDQPTQACGNQNFQRIVVDWWILNAPSRGLSNSGIFI